MKVNWFWLVISIIITTAVLGNSLYYSYLMVKYSGPVLSNNWWGALNWIKENTPQCAVIATYWDPGHFITGIAERPVVFDGASQNTKRTVILEGNLTEDEIRKVIGIDNFVYTTFEKNGKVYTNVTTARIQDIATTLFTNNETQAIKILKRYLMPNCNNTMYYIVSADLVQKSQWWTYFSTWSPEAHSGTKYYYLVVPLSNMKLLNNQTVWVYSLSPIQSILIFSDNNTLKPFFQQGENAQTIKRIFYFDQNGVGLLKSYNDAVMEGMVWVDPSYKFVVYIPEQLINSLFTRMFFFNGEGLKHFEFVRNFGGEVKLFKVDFE